MYDDYDPKVRKAILEGKLDPADAKWMNEYARTPGSNRVETGTTNKDMSQKMENYMNRIKSGEVSGEGFKDRFAETRGRGSVGPSGSIDIEGLPARLRPSGGKRMQKGGKVKSASDRADGIAKRGKTRGRIV